MVSSVTPFSGMDPSPRVDVFVDGADLTGSTASVTVWQISSAGEFPVRNAERRPSSGGFFVTDYEVPLGVPVSYRVQEFDAGGAEIQFALNLDTQVDVADGYAVIQDPLVPNNAVLVEAHVDFGGVLVKRRAARTYRAGNDTVALLGQQGLLEDVPLRCQTRSIADADVLEAILDETQFLVRLMPSGGRLPSVLHVVVPDVVQVPVDVQYGGSWIQWDLQGSQVARTELDIIVPVVSYQRYVDAFASYAEFNAAYSTYLSAIASPPPEA